MLEQQHSVKSRGVESKGEQAGHNFPVLFGTFKHREQGTEMCGQERLVRHGFKC